LGDAPQDEAWLRFSFDAAELDPAFTIPEMDAGFLTPRAVTDLEMDDAA
jgi:hypothetical protein